MTENIETTKKTEKTATPDLNEGKTLYNFTTEGIVVYAKSLEEAQEIYHKTLKDTKESNNG